MKRLSKKEELSNPHLKILKKDFERIQKAGEYLKSEKAKLKKDEEETKKKLKKEKEILGFKRKICFLQNPETKKRGLKCKKYE